METAAMESCVPPGFRFHPTDEELVGYYLKKKIASQKIDLDVIRDVDLYRIEPWDLQERCRIGYEEQNEWYFFSHKDKKYPTGTRTNRATVAGFWKATGRDKAVYEKTKLIGMRKTLVFYKGRAPNGQKTDWIMHEYRLESDENGPPQEEGWVVCRAFKKRTAASVQPNKAMEGGWDTSYFYDESSRMSSVNEPIADGHDYASSRHQAEAGHGHGQYGFLQHSPNLFCKQEIESSSSRHHHDPLQFINSDQFLQLPQLESPSVPAILKRPNPMNNHGNNINPNNDQLQIINTQLHNGNKYYRQDPDNYGQEVTDWRMLDKFVASQLMSTQSDHVDDQDQEATAGDDTQDPIIMSAGNFGGGQLDDNESEMGLLMLPINGRPREDHENNKLAAGFLMISSSGGSNSTDNI
ncbi:hypothetical protein Dimus_017349 [Dionaea muscipula]